MKGDQYLLASVCPPVAKGAAQYYHHHLFCLITPSQVSDKVFTLCLHSRFRCSLKATPEHDYLRKFLSANKLKLWAKSLQKCGDCTDCTPISSLQEIRSVATEGVYNIRFSALVGAEEWAGCFLHIDILSFSLTSFFTSITKQTCQLKRSLVHFKYMPFKFFGVVDYEGIDTASFCSA